jgi:hypothetical protein
VCIAFQGTSVFFGTPKEPFVLLTKHSVPIGK